MHKCPDCHLICECAPGNGVEGREAYCIHPGCKEDPFGRIPRNRRQVCQLDNIIIRNEAKAFWIVLHPQDERYTGFCNKSHYEQFIAKQACVLSLE